MKPTQWRLDGKVPWRMKTTAMTVNKDEILAIKRYVRSLGPVGYKLGEEMRPTLDGSDAPDRWALSEADLLDINRQDPELWNETCGKQSQQTPSCVSGS